MAKKDSSEETTKGLVADKLKEIDGYPMAQNTTVDGITWFKEDSYKGTSYDWLKDVFKKASKKQTMRSKGTPDYVVTLDGSDIIIVIECKGSVDDHSCLDDVEDYVKHGYGGADETEKYAINGALWYASFLKSDYDVISIGISGQTEQTARVSSFVWPKGEEISSIALIEDGYLDNSLVSITQYKSDVNSVLGRMGETEETVRKQLRRYTLNCATGKIPLNEALSDFGDIDIGMINPPYSLDKKDNSSKQEYPIVKQINELKDKNKRLNKKIKEYRKKTDGKDYSEAIFNCQNEIKANNDLLNKYEKDFTNSGLREVAIQKGQDELDFIASMLHYLKKGGIGLAIVPMSCAGNSGTKLRAELLKYHTLLACMTMPPQLFYDSHVGTATCIMVFKAHIPHDKNKATFFGRWQNDGFKVIPHNGRKDTGAWSSIREEWINQLDGTAAIDDTIWLRKKINPNDEALAEAYIETDYNKLDDSVFERTIKKYALYKYMDEKGLLGD